MATRPFGINPNDPSNSVVENVGSACTSAFINVTVDIASTVVTEGSSTRVISKSEFLRALERLKEYIIRQNTWPPA